MSHYHRVGAWGWGGSEVGVSECWRISPIAPQSILVFPTFLFIPFCLWSKCDSHSIISSFFSFGYCKRHFMHSEVWSLFFIWGHQCFLLIISSTFPLYQQIPFFLDTMGLSQSLAPWPSAFDGFFWLLLFYFPIIFDLVSSIKLTPLYGIGLSLPLAIKLQNPSAGWWLLQHFSLICFLLFPTLTNAPHFLFSLQSPRLFAAHFLSY